MSRAAFALAALLGIGAASGALAAHLKTGVPMPRPPLPWSVSDSTAVWFGSPDLPAD
jgi:hypothetical protein